jgi:hypothetical protein
MAQMHKLIQRPRRDGGKIGTQKSRAWAVATALLASRHGNAISRLLIDQVQAVAPLHVN